MDGGRRISNDSIVGHFEIARGLWSHLLGIDFENETHNEIEDYQIGCCESELAPSLVRLGPTKPSSNITDNVVRDYDEYLKPPWPVRELRHACVTFST